MSLPVSQYEALLVAVRGLKEKAQHVQQLATPLISSTNSSSYKVSNDHLIKVAMMASDPSDFGIQKTRTSNEYVHQEVGGSEDELNGSVSTHLSTNSEPITFSSNVKPFNNLYHGTWPVERTWNSDSMSGPMDVTSVMSFNSSSGGAPLDRVLNSPTSSRRSSQQLEAKVDMVYSLLAMLGGQEHADMSETLLALSTNPESCLAMRQSGCVSLLVQLVHSDKDSGTRKKASQALHNLIMAQPDEKLRKRESRVLKLLDQVRMYNEALLTNTPFEIGLSPSTEDIPDDKHPVQVIAHLMKLSFDEGHRQAICQLGGIQIIATLIECEHTVHGSTTDEAPCILMRRYACMALTNLTFGDSGNKALLCSFRKFMLALVAQLQSSSDELRQVTASVLRNLSWRADPVSKNILREVGTVTGLMKAAMVNCKENTLKSILSALWNLSAHCVENKAEICAVEGALGFLVDMLTYKTPSKSLAVIENSGGILRNVSSHIAIRDDYREILRKHNCLQILLEQLKSPSLTIVSNACGTLWNLSAKCPVDQEALWQMGAPSMLRSLNHSKHKMIAMGSSAALKNLLSSRPSHSIVPQLDATAMAMDLPTLPTLGARKQKALLQDLDSNLTETFENIEVDSPKKDKNEAEKICTGLAGLSISEPSTSYQKIPIKSKGVPSKSCSTSLNSGEDSNQYSYRNQYNFDEVEQPINYSQKYSETKLPTKFKTKQYNKTPAESKKQNSKSQYAYPKHNEPDLSIYAETDLDQPTDYSLRYAEDDSSSDICNKDSSDARIEFVQDTVKTYYTEGTPYETPYFSNATSMSDLRVDQPLEENDKNFIDNDRCSQYAANVGKKVPKVSQLDEKDHCSVEDISEMEKSKPPEFNSGMLSPEKPVNYCDEGTPGYFSRVGSFGSLNSIPCNENKTAPIQNQPTKESVKESTKTVKFEKPSTCTAEETPLMFSRSSSLASLNSVEQHSIHDDQSSVVSDFSRLTSGIISPSEIPDSPTQSVSPSPQPRKGKFMQQKRPQPTPRSLKSVFEDNVTKFKEENTPVQFSTATSLSSLITEDHYDQDQENVVNYLPGEERLSVMASGASASTQEDDGKEKQDSEKEKQTVDLNDESELSENENDEDILANCISIGMQSKTQNTSANLNKSFLPKYQLKLPSKLPLPLSMQSRNAPGEPSKSFLDSDSVRPYCTEDTPAELSHACSNTDLSVLSMPNESKSRKGYLSDDSSNLSGESENILAECIQSAMPKSKRIGEKAGVGSSKPQTSTPIKPFSSQPEKSKGIVPVQDNIKSNLIRYAPGLVKDEVSSYAVENSPCLFSVRSSLSDLTIEDGAVELSREKISNQAEGNPEQNSRSRNDSLSSVSVESVGSIETEQALLEQCISSGMPKTKSNTSVNKTNATNKNATEKPVGIATKQFNIPKPKTSPNPKNVNVASATNHTPPTTDSHQKAEIVVADVGCDDKEADPKTNRLNAPPQLETTTSPAKFSLTEENLLAEMQKSGSEKNYDNASSDQSVSDNCAYSTDQDLVMNDENCTLSQIVDNRMLDPNAMIESLDRFTAELVSHHSHLENKDLKQVESNADGDTWNEESSSNDVTFPSLSGSVPNVITFQSEGRDVDQIDGLGDKPSNDFSSLDTSTMTESTLIAIEATKIATTFQQESDLSISMTSAISLELDKVDPPSHLNSLVNSAIDFDTSKPSSPKSLFTRRNLPITSIARRALNNSLQATSLDSLEGNSLTNLDSVNPPSVMGDVFDLESSITSIDSLPNEKNDFNPIFSILQPNNMPQSMTDLENVNPPSLFNEITDLYNSLADVATDTICSQTEVFEDCFTHIVETEAPTEEDITEFSDANSVTPIHSEPNSSAESSPKKGTKLHKYLTPKQRRSLARDRYRTYTIAAEMTMKEQEVPYDDTKSNDSTTADFQTVDCLSESFKTANPSTTSPQAKPTRVTPKEKRQNDRSRFQTQTLNKSLITMLHQSKIQTSSNDNSEDSSSDMHALVQEEANAVLKTLSETKTRVDDLLDCETLSLVSNEDDSEHNSGHSVNYRTYHKSWGFSRNNIPVIQSTIPGQDNYATNNLVNDAKESNETPKIPRIRKPTDPSEEEQNESGGDDGKAKAIRGRRKPLYAKSSPGMGTKNARTVTSNLVKNVTTTIKSNTGLRIDANKNKSGVAAPKTTSKIAAPKSLSNLRYAQSNQKNVNTTNQMNNNKTMPEAVPKLERQGTFTKPETSPPQQPKSRIPTTNMNTKPPTSRIARAVTTIGAAVAKSTKPLTSNSSKTIKQPTKSSSTDRTGRASSLQQLTKRSSSGDGREMQRRGYIHSSSSNQSLKGGVSSPDVQRMPVSTSTTPPSPSTSTKQVASRIATLWKKIEESKKQPIKKDTRKWIQGSTSSNLIRSKTFDSKDSIVSK